MMATAREHNVSEDDLKTLVMDIAKVPSRKLIPADRFLTVIEAIKNWGTWQAELAPERQEDVG
jgi:putative heme iron utilization protein